MNSINATLAELIAAGGSPWTSADGTSRRVYFNDLAGLLGLDVTYYNVGADRKLSHF